ncbi:hypothetical protein A4_440 [Escherichia phage A4]|nr:hypothetical protein A4_440 [Escherichia phage A4]
MNELLLCHKTYIMLFRTCHDMRIEGILDYPTMMINFRVLMDSYSQSVIDAFEGREIKFKNARTNNELCDTIKSVGISVPNVYVIPLMYGRVVSTNEIISI